MKHEPVSMQKFLRLCFGTAFRSSADVPKRTAERRVSTIPSDVPVLKKEECSAAGNFEGRRRFLALLFSASASFFCGTGCQSMRLDRASYSTFEGSGPAGENAQNPLEVRGDLEPFQVWETVVDVVRLYFDRIVYEYPCQKRGDIILEGLLETKPQIGSTCFEPWRRDSVTASERQYATVQTIRRTAKVRVRFADGHYLIHVSVKKELEDPAQPLHMRLPSATFRLDTKIDDRKDPIGVQDSHEGWIPQKRDYALEQSILNQIQFRLNRKN